MHHHDHHQHQYHANHTSHTAYKTAAGIALSTILYIHHTDSSRHRRRGRPEGAQATRGGTGEDRQGAAYCVKCHTRAPPWARGGHSWGQGMRRTSGVFGTGQLCRCSNGTATASGLALGKRHPARMLLLHRKALRERGCSEQWTWAAVPR
eukprot:217105-Chlamydomonas_euryale.AAC.2